MLIREVTDCAVRAESACLHLSNLLHDENAKDVLPPLPVRLTLADLEEWLTRAEESAKKPRLAKSKRLLAENGIDATSIPADVLDKPDDLAGLTESLRELPKPVQDKARISLGAALTKGVSDARGALSRFTTAAQALSSLKGIEKARPWLYSLGVGEVAANPTAAESIVDRVLGAHSLLTEPDRLGLEEPIDISSLEQMESALKKFNNALAPLNTALVRESLGRSEIPSLKGKDLSEAQDAFRQTLDNVEREKKELMSQSQDLSARLEELGISVESSEEKVAVLRRRVPELRARLEARREALRQSLGADTLMVLEALTKGDVPAKTKVTDEQLGTAIRKLAAAGYCVSLEIGDEDKRQ